MNTSASLTEKLKTSDSEYLTPLCGKALGKFELSHAPRSGDPLSGKKQRITAIHAVDRVNDQHQANFFILLH
jgi:hypothetical protein